MALKLNRSITSKIDGLTGQINFDTEYTNTLVASGSSTALSGSNQSLVSIPVPAGAQLIVTGVYYYAGAATTFALTYTQTVLGVPQTQTVYYSLVSAGDSDDIRDVKAPILSMVNLTTSAVLVSLNVVTATSGTQYTGDLWYVLR